jgi:hypothetical protein
MILYLFLSLLAVLESPVQLTVSNRYLLVLEFLWL